MGARTVVVGFGVVGAAAAKHVLRGGLDPGALAVVDTCPHRVREAVELGAVGHHGDAMTRAILGQALDDQTRCVIVTAGPDATAVLVTMLARNLCPTATVITSVRDPEFVDHAKRAGADEVFATAEWAGRALACAIEPPR